MPDQPDNIPAPSGSYSHLAEETAANRSEFPLPSRPDWLQGRDIMAYVPCYACGINHKNIPQREIIQVLTEFQEGTAQVVTPEGIVSRCILDSLGLPPTQRKERENKNGKPIAADLALSGVC